MNSSWDFLDESTLAASAANAVSDGTQHFIDRSKLAASATNALSGGTQYFWNSSALAASTGDAIIGGTQSFQDSSRLTASAANALSGGTQRFNGSSTLAASAANAVSGGMQSFYGNSSLVASTAAAVSRGAQDFYANSSLAASAAHALSGGTQRFYNSSTLTVSATDAVSGGVQYFFANSTLAASAADAVSGGTQGFYNNSTLAATTANALNGGTQSFLANSMLAASAANALNGGTQSFYVNSTLAASAANAVSGGRQGFYNNSTLAAATANAVSGGAQDFNGNSTLAASAANAISGGSQYFRAFSRLNASAAYAVSGGAQNFYDNTALAASAANAVSGGTQYFYTDSSLAASTADAVSGGTQNFYNNTTLVASAANAVSGGSQAFYDNSTLGVGANNALTPSTALSFDNVSGGAGGTLALNGHSTLVGRLTSMSAGSGIIINNGSSNAVLTVDGTLLEDSVFSGIIADGSGGGTLGLNKAGNSTLTLSGANTYTGDTQIHSGKLIVGSVSGSAARILGSVSVANGATLAGHGAVGSTTVASGGTLAPGNSIGTLTVNGDLTMSAGSIYQVEVDTTSTDSTRVAVTGTASLLGGSVVHVGPDGVYTPGLRYTILSAGAGINGVFSQTSSNYAYLIPKLDYTSTAVTLELIKRQVPVDPIDPVKPPNLPVRDIQFSDLATTENQRSTANGLQSLPESNGLYQSILTLAEGAPPATFDNLSGEIHANVTSALQSSAYGVRTMPFKHLRNNLSAKFLAGAPTADARMSDAPVNGMLASSGALPAWAEVVGTWQTINSNGNAAQTTQRTGGLFIGADRGVGNGWRLGAALGYTDSNVQTEARASSADVSSYSATIYGGKAFEARSGKVNLLMGGSYTWHDLSTTRNVNTAGLNQTLNADYGASTSQLFAELGYAMPLATATIEPFTGIAWSDTRTRGFSESGGSAALSGQSQSYHQASTTLGLRGSTPYKLGRTTGTLRASVGWRHAFGSITPITTMAFSGGQAFSVAGVPIARDAGLLELGADVAIARSATVGVGYTGQLGNGSRENAANVNVRWQF